MDKIIEDTYIEFNLPSVDKLYTILKKQGHSIPKDKIKSFIDKLNEQQLTKQTKINKKSYGSIVSFHPNVNFQIDIFDLSKYSNYNKNYKYIFVMIDIFSRKAYSKALKNKDIDSTTKALGDIIKENKLQPNSITSDSDSSFLGGKFQKLIEKNKIHHETVILDDHRGLGIIDRFARTLKTIFTRIFLRNKTKNWIDYLDNTITSYNKTPHSSLNNIAPIEATKQDNQDIIYNLNTEKNKKNVPVNDIKIGDLVRIKITGLFKKGTDPTYSDELYKVLSIKGKTIELDDDNKYKRENLLVVPKDSEKEFKNVIKEVNKENRIKRKLNKEGLDTTLLK
jgi:hypothetical protein